MLESTVALNGASDASCSLAPLTCVLLCCSGTVGCQKVTERVSTATAITPLDDRFPAIASYSRQYLADESATGSYAEFEITNLANSTVNYQSNHIFAGQVGKCRAYTCGTLAVDATIISQTTMIMASAAAPTNMISSAIDM